MFTIRQIPPPLPAAPPHPTSAPSLTPSQFAIDLLNFHPDEKQRRVLDSPSQRGILNCTRQWGKSTVAAIKAVHRARTVPGSLILVASPSERQSALLLRKARDFVIQLDLAPKRDGDNPLSLLFPNASRIVGLPGSSSTVRGFSAVSLLLIDEAAHVDDELYKTLQPMLIVSDGDLWLMSTPNGKQGFFHDEWTQGPPDWERIAVPATECPRIRPAVLDRQRTGLGQDWFAQEYMCEFVGSGSKWFDPDVVDEAVSDHEPIVGRR